MLVLTRWPGETLIIGDDIRVTVLDASGNQVRLGVTAPREVPVHREEVARRIRGERADAVGRLYIDYVHRGKDRRKSIP